MTRILVSRAAVGALLLMLPGSCLGPASRLPLEPRGFAAAATPGTIAANPGPPAPLFPANSFVLPLPPQQGLAMVAAAPAGTQAVTLDGARLPVTDNGQFLLAFDRDAPPVATLGATLADGRMVTMMLSVAAGRWRIEQVNAPWRGGAGNDAEFARRRPAELTQINAARRTAANSGGWQQSFVWPVRGRLSGFFGSQRVYQGKPGSYHSGLDIAAPGGTRFVAPADGIVVLAAAAPFTLEGNLLIVDHGMGLTSAFLHAARLDVTTGQVVRQGEPLGAVGATGRATGPHLHWGMRWRQAKIDPLLLLPR